VKIAQVFMVDLHANMGNAAIVRAAIGLATDLKLDVVVEGVETVEQLNLVRTWSGTNVQGYYFSRPLPAREIAALLRVGRIDIQATTPVAAAAAA
jgi:EAL domain-containing protein (putative c-di-GMP-specific phosphodiesterase class I)